MKDRIPCRLIEEIGTRVVIGMHWGHDCPNSYGAAKRGPHFAEAVAEEMLHQDDPNPKRNLSDYLENKWPTQCIHCGTAVPGLSYDDLHPFMAQRRLYNTDSGKPEPGDMYYASWHHHPDYKKAMCQWDNCNDPRGHLIVVLPNGSTWDLDSRASNCTMKSDRLHRCWVRAGEPPNLHVDKNGHTCAAGAGSIAVDKYHGFLHHGHLVKC